MTLDAEGTRLLFELSWWVGGAGVFVDRFGRKLVAIDRHVDLALRFGRWCEREPGRWDAAHKVTGLDLTSWILGVTERATFVAEGRDAIFIADTWMRIEEGEPLWWGEKLLCLARCTELDAVYAEIERMQERRPDSPVVALYIAKALRTIFEGDAAVDEVRRGLSLSAPGDPWHDELERFLTELLDEDE